MLNMDTRKINKLDDDLMKDKFDRWYSNNKDLVSDFEKGLNTQKSKEELIIANAFKYLHLYTDDVERLKAYITFEFKESSPRDAATIIGGYIKLSSELNQGNYESLDAYLHQIKANELIDRRSFTIQRLLKDYNQSYKLEDSLKPRV